MKLKKISDQVADPAADQATHSARTEVRPEVSRREFLRRSGILAGESLRQEVEVAPTARQSVDADQHPGIYGIAPFRVSHVMEAALAEALHLAFAHFHPFTRHSNSTAAWCAPLRW